MAGVVGPAITDERANASEQNGRRSRIRPDCQPTLHLKYLTNVREFRTGVCIDSHSAGRFPDGFDGTNFAYFRDKENQMFKRFVIFALVCVSVASAKTYNFTVTAVAQAGNTQLKPGDYSLKVDRTQVVLKDNAGHRIDIGATLEDADQKFNETAVVLSNADGTNRIQWI